VKNGMKKERAQWGYMKETDGKFKEKKLETEVK
jgi:hypothetical protein